MILQLLAEPCNLMLAAVSLSQCCVVKKKYLEGKVDGVDLRGLASHYH